MTTKSVSLLVGMLLVINCLTAVAADDPTTKHAGSPPRFITYSAPVTLAFDELLEISKSSAPPVSLLSKLDALLTSPIISNEAYYAAPEPSAIERPGRFIRVGQWNIERGSQLDDIKLALENPEEFISRIKHKSDSIESRAVLDELNALRRVDVIVLNEVDLGIKRTGYRDVARELAAALRMNYLYGVEFIEVDPLNLGTEEFKQASPEETAEFKKMIEVDRERYRGLHGTAILSRFPIKSARLVPLKYQAYDWLNKERNKTSVAEAARRQLGRLAFLEQYPRQVRVGGRSILIAELEVPHVAEGSITVVATHLENRCGPDERRRQIKEVLSLIRDIKGPLVLAGDFNTSGSNLSPTSIRNEIMKRVKDKSFWIKSAVKWAVSFGPTFDFLIEAVSFARTAHDPTSKGFFIFGANEEAGLFKEIERMRFDDGYAFDFRGDADRTVNGTKGTLANSNHRAKTKGFLTTHAMSRTFWAVGKTKLDWIFVKAYARNPRGKNESYLLAPQHPRTLEKFNYSLGHRLSDHNPIIVDLPVDQPK